MNPNAILTVSICFAATLVCADEFPTFDVQTIDPHVGKICYAVIAADVDNDTKVDIVAVSEKGVYWYQNPAWTKRVIIEDQTPRDNVCIAAADVNGDGQIEFALGAGWTKAGTIRLLSRGNSLDETWNVSPIDDLPWTHRMRFADVLGTGQPQLVVSPLNKSAGEGVKLTAYEIPEHPLTDRWMPTVLDQSLNRLHNHWHVDLNDDARMDTLTASQEGVHLIRLLDGTWTKQQLSPGAEADTAQQSGAGEIKLGRLGNGNRFIATVEPMHGNMAVVYVQQPDQTWRRNVVDDSLKRGHAVWLADLDQDGADEFVIGHSDPGDGPIKGPGVYVYDAVDVRGDNWKKHVIDNGGIATEDAFATDVNGDGWIDIIAGGRSTHNVKLYLNQGKE